MISISVSGLSHAIKTVERLANIQEKCEELAKKLCEIGEPIIRQVHGHHASVWSEPMPNGYKICAEGEDVLFIEFGAGDAAGREAGNYDQVPTEVRPRSWSETHAQMYAKYGFWFFGNEKYTEVPPSPAFYYAYEYMVQNLPTVAKEVFGS